MFSQCLAVFIKKAPPLLFLLNMPIFFFLTTGLLSLVLWPVSCFFL